MNILPRYLLLFQAFPVEISSKQFSELNKIITRFIRQVKNPGLDLELYNFQKSKGEWHYLILKIIFMQLKIRPQINLCNPSYQVRWKDIELSTLVDPQYKQYYLTNT